MFILALNLDWFMTIPGILISLGIVLLIVAVILFIAGNKKSKKDASVSEMDTNYEENMNNNFNDVAPVAPIEPVEVVTPAATNIVETVPNDTMVVPEKPVFEEIDMGRPGETVVEIPSIQPEPVISIQPEPVISTADIKPMDEMVLPVESTPVVSEPIDFDKTMVSVYGGQNPVESVAPTVSEQPKSIYGGNDPLEATQSIPKVEEAHAPYGGAISEVKLVEPVDDSVVQVPQVEPIQVPEVAPIPVEIPSFEEKPISFDIPVTPVEIPSVPVEENKPVVEEL